MTLEQLKQFIKQVKWGFLATTDGRIVGVRLSPVHLVSCSPALFCPASPDYVIIKMTPDNIRTTCGEPVESMESTDMKYSQVKLE